MTFHIREHVVPTSHIREYPGATAHDQEELLHLHVKQYTPADVTEHALDAVTIVGATGIGFPKVSHLMVISYSQKPKHCRNSTSHYGKKFTKDPKPKGLPSAGYGSRTWQIWAGVQS